MRRLHGWHVVAVALALLLAPQTLAAPRRVVSTYLCTDEYVFRLVPRDHIAALSFLAADRHPVVSTIVDEVAGIPLVHDSAEEVLARRPDVVVMFAGMQPRLHAQLRAAGVRVIDVNYSASLADIRRETLALGRALGEEGRARGLLNAMDRTLVAAKPASPAVNALIYEPNGYVASDSVTDEIMGRAGLINIASAIGVTRSGLIPVETVVADPPELLLLGGSDPHPALANRMMDHPALAAIASGMLIAPVSLQPLACPGPWSADVAPDLARLGRQARALAQARGGP